MGQVTYSNCSTITTGCYIYNDIYKSSPVSNGYYSDGTNCYTVDYGNGYVVSVASCTTPLYININGPDQADSSGETPSGSVQVPSQNTSSYTNSLGNYVAPTSNLTVDIVCYGSTNTAYDTCYIYSSNLCSTTGPMFAGLDPNETIDGYGVTGVSPTSDSTYTYNAGNGYRNSTYSYC